MLRNLLILLAIFAFQNCGEEVQLLKKNSPLALTVPCRPPVLAFIRMTRRCGSFAPEIVAVGEYLECEVAGQVWREENACEQYALLKCPLDGSVSEWVSHGLLPEWIVVDGDGSPWCYEEYQSTNQI